MKFELTEEQVEKFNKWKKTTKFKRLYKKGGIISVNFIYGSIGITVQGKISINGEADTVNLTDYTTW